LASVGIALITHCAKKHLKHALPPLLQATVLPKILVVNSSSHDGTVELATEMGVDTLVIPRKAFNHGTTRECARRKLGTEIVVMMTPDAYAVSNETIERLIEPIVEKRASAAYARQLPHRGADFFEAFSRRFNYPDKSQIREYSDLSKYGAYTFFNSDSCAAYCNEALEEIGGFPRVLIGEDTVVAAKLIRKGKKVAYVAEAMVYHSHSYNLRQEFQRHFDTGLSRKMHAELMKSPGGDERRGFDYLRALFSEAPAGHIPYAALHLLAKYSGYRLGKLGVYFPKRLNRFFSAQRYYWDA